MVKAIFIKIKKPISKIGLIKFKIGDPAGTRTQNVDLGAINKSCFNFFIAHSRNSYKHYSTQFAKLQSTFLTFAP